jgi:hypothetical protein
VDGAFRHPNRIAGDNFAFFGSIPDTANALAGQDVEDFFGIGMDVFFMVRGFGLKPGVTTSDL